MKFFLRYFGEIVLIFLVLLGFWYRINGLETQYSFWTDEASTARFARGILETGLPQISSTGYKENSYFVTHYLTAVSFMFLGKNELSARLPEVVFGILLILITFFIGKKLFNNLTGLGAAALTTFSYIQIAWSRQARGYVILEVFLLLSIYFLYQFLETGKKRPLFLSIVFSFLSIWTHTLGLIVVPIIFFGLLWKINLKVFLSKRTSLLITLFSIGLIIICSNFRYAISWVYNYKIINFGKEIFLSYYHSLFWRQYSLISFLTYLGFLALLNRKKKNLFLILFSFTVIYLFIISFLIAVPFEKYALPIFPIMFLVSSYSLFFISNYFSKTKIGKTLVFSFFLLFILLNGDKFSIKPRQFYTLNLDMREIPEIDYKGIYSFVESKIGDYRDREKTAIVDLSHDLPFWYLGEKIPVFIPRNDVSEAIKENPNSGAVFLHNLEEVKEIYDRYPKGFVVLVEHNFRFYPSGLVEFCREKLNLEKREEFAWFSPDWNRWPIELYSWDKNK
ncbi:MAG TPA: glycosyltransferase family 39 protein [Candidatus Bathyarchaeia archaeon]|nr:glycosyltransferase family 39 protein [Candidatus Bathyarchaeia archaeon]